MLFLTPSVRVSIHNISTLSLPWELIVGVICMFPEGEWVTPVTRRARKHKKSKEEKEELAGPAEKPQVVQTKKEVPKISVEAEEVAAEEEIQSTKKIPSGEASKDPLLEPENVIYLTYLIS